MAQELYHYGILGMKWGIRRYQNPDGSLTDKGKAHYGAGTSLGSKGRLGRAIDAAQVATKIDKLESKDRFNGKRTAKIKALKTAYKGLVKDLDARELKYGRMAEKYIDEVAKVDGVFTFIGGPLVGSAAALGYAAVYKNFSKEGKEFSKLERDLKEANRKAMAKKKK